MLKGKIIFTRPSSADQAHISMRCEDAASRTMPHLFVGGAPEAPA